MLSYLTGNECTVLFASTLSLMRTSIVMLVYVHHTMLSLFTECVCVRKSNQVQELKNGRKINTRVEVETLTVGPKLPLFLFLSYFFFQAIAIKSFCWLIPPC